MCIPKQFEYVDVLYDFEERPEIPKFVTILDEFVHHYSGTKFYRIRIEYLSSFLGRPMVEYETVDEKKLFEMLEKQRKGACV